MHDTFARDLVHFVYTPLTDGTKVLKQSPSVCPPCCAAPSPAILRRQENNLTKTLRMLQAESSVCLNTIDNLDNLMSDINHGRWEAVMPQVGELFP